MSVVRKIKQNFSVVDSSFLIYSVIVYRSEIEG